MTKMRKSQISAVTTALGSNFASILSDEPSETGCNFGESENLMNSPTSTKVKTFMVDAIDMDKKFAMMDQTIEALKKSVNEKDHQIARLMSMLDLYNPEESNYNLTPSEKVDGESLIKTSDNYYADRSASVATLTVQQLQNMIANTIKAQYGGIKPQTFEELATFAYDMELSIASHRMTSPDFDPKKEVTKFEDSSEDQIGKSMTTTSKQPEESNKVDDPKYCKFHYIVGHHTTKCFILKEKIMTIMKEGKIIIDEGDTVDANHVSAKLHYMKGSISKALQVMRSVESPKVVDIIMLQFWSFDPFGVLSLKKTTGKSMQNFSNNAENEDFSYKGNAENGPGNWGNINPQWRICNTGKLQSPVDLVKVEVVNLGILEKFYKPAPAALVNRGHDIMVRWDGDAGFLKINETQYKLQQVHWHTPSEHTINGKRFDMEAHLVHASSDGKTAVIGILYTIGLLPDILQTKLEKDLIALADKEGAERAIGIVDPNIIKLDGTTYYRYIGSLTTPPCTEGVVWTIDGKVNSATSGQIKLLQNAVVNWPKGMPGSMPNLCSSRSLVFLVLENGRHFNLDGSKYDEREFSYGEKSENGPANWGKIHPEWRTCNTGKLQSPIDLLNKRVEVVSDLGILKKYYKPSNATLLNRGHDMMLRWEGSAGYLKINGTQYQLKQVHWHTPSEHTIDGKRFSLEAHLVHESNDGKTAVIGIIYKIGRPDSFLSMIETDLKALASAKGVEKAIGTINPKQIKLDGKKYYRYIGSLTTPPCTEDVVWTIDRKVKTVTKRQMKLIRDAVHDTSWTSSNPSRRYWACPYYGRWRDSEDIDPRSKYVIPKLIEKLGELENVVESCRFNEVEKLIGLSKSIKEDSEEVDKPKESKHNDNGINMKLEKLEEEI
ncbi:Bifunctional monodehydroascorbate reductase and carbonic anhydrase nectarin-3 [Capsicum annuum]|uniref:Carbonic anhydrase n=1 Tax=Capsicum annuum TaxID=4072 RepID=A0A2G2ZDL0_CAPAN|nr:Bifunctional monodehydroascorbate reductase and carbonic anhydrase nectarin-3 [Capsicum annuum]